MRITRRAGLKGLTSSAAAVAIPGMARSEEPEIVIGAPNSLTGGIGEGGQRTVWALQIAIDQIKGKGAIAVFAPPLDEAGNSVKGQEVIDYVTERLHYNLFSPASVGLQ